jgi:predicted deacylase
MKIDKLYVASVEPYTLSDHENFKRKISTNPLVKINTIGKTVEGRPLEIIRVGHADAPHRILIRARAHAWEPGGNWVVQGLINSLLQKDAISYLNKYCIYVMPMANKDGVVRGRSRFNILGKDLNRNWDQPADSIYAPENYALEMWLKKMIQQELKPDLAIDLHNDSNGKLHVSRPNVNFPKYLENMKRLETLLYKYTWFREGPTGGDFRNPGSFGEGLLERYDIDACIYEFNYEWIAGLNKVPLGKDWELLGKELRDVFFNYFNR